MLKARWARGIAYLRRGGRGKVDDVIIDSGNEDSTLAQARRTAAHLTSGIIGVVVESWAGFTAALALDAELGVRGVRVRPLSLSERTARATLATHPWWRLRYAARPATAIIFGTGPVAEHLVIALFRSMHLSHQKPQVVVIDPQAPEWVAALRQALPQLAEIGSLVGARSAAGLEDVCMLYAVAAHADISSFPAAVPLVWLAKDDAPRHARRVVPPTAHALARYLLIDPQDARAEAIHSFYFEAALRDGNAPGSRPSMLPWAQLPERFRQASRYQADHVPAKLAMIGCHEMRAAGHWHFRYAAGEVEALAKVEHERWSAVQLLDGWRYGATRDDAARLTPFLKPYDELSPDIQDRDRMPVRQIPAQLARIGHGVKRDIVVTLSADRQAEPGFSFSFLFRGLLSDIAARYPDRRLVLASTLDSPIARQAAAVALGRRVPLLALLPANLAVPSQSASLLQRAERLLAMDDMNISARGGLHIHVGSAPPPAQRLVLLETNGKIQAAPWF